MINNDKVQMRVDKLKKQQEKAENIDRVCNGLIHQLQNTNYKVLDSFKPYINPKINIEKLLEFYEFYLNSSEKIQAYKDKINSNLFNAEAGLTLEKLESENLLDTLKGYQNILSELSSYHRIKIVKTLIRESKDYYNKVLKELEKVFFNSLTRLPLIPKFINLYAVFLMDNIDKKLFLSDYTQKLYSILGFSDIPNLTSLISRTDNLSEYFLLIRKINNEVLGVKDSKNINIGITQLLIINLKKVITEILLNIERNPNSNKVVGLVNLHRNLRHKDSTIIKEIEELFIFKKQILKLILNCFIRYFTDMEMISTPREDLKTENQVSILIKIFKAFEKNESLKNTWVKEYGPSFGVYQAENFYDNFGRKCLNKVITWSTTLKDFEHYIYQINQKVPFKGYIKSYNGEELNKSIDKDVNLIIGLWRINMDKFKGIELNNYVLKQLHKYKSAYLPEQERLTIQYQLSEIVEMLIASSSLEGNTNKLKTAIEESYTGSK